MNGGKLGVRTPRAVILSSLLTLIVAAAALPGTGQAGSLLPIPTWLPVPYDRHIPDPPPGGADLPFGCSPAIGELVENTGLEVVFGTEELDPDLPGYDGYWYSYSGVSSLSPLGVFASRSGHTRGNPAIADLGDGTRV
jgi:hypothetical protein